MKKVLTAMALSLSAMIATSAIAAPQDYQDNRHYSQPSHWNNQYNQQNNNRYEHDRYDRDHRRVNPSREWRTGQYLPNQFSSSRYQINYKNYRHLPKPGRYQQWYKINGDYVLVNERNHQIIRIVG
ncbi:RcnB family protein [Acinetobacter silvestris]|uniref:RcnB family protein n=1 Tax=Acinetobacter silvestris TaxID=1977882 RepID=A0A1Y3C9W1_9GAMM|nr:RcnB family protein [Acinetobacter silvestris]OTG63809.1 hypothetical protein B9T28_12525 [Acinetobacter silvestris]